MSPNKSYLIGKFDERDAKVPRLCELNAFLSNRYSVSDILHIEIMLLEFFDWNLCVPTPAHYIDYFTKRAISGNDLIMNKPISSLTHLKNNMKDFVNYFLDISIQGTSFFWLFLNRI